MSKPALVTLKIMFHRVILAMILDGIQCLMHFKSIIFSAVSFVANVRCTQVGLMYDRLERGECGDIRPQLD